MNPAVSVVVPVWNEATALPRCLAALRCCGTPIEVLVADAGSSDCTREIAARFEAKVIESPIRQRAAQMNFGAAQSRAAVLLFLHADTLLPEGGIDRILSALEEPRVGGGAFARRFDSRSAVLKTTCALAALRNAAIGWHLGDQAMFVRRGLFEQLGGFAAWDRFEDLDFSRRLGRISRLVTLRPPVLSSARRFEKEGALLRTWRDFRLTMRYLRGDQSVLYHRGPDSVEKIGAPRSNPAPVDVASGPLRR